MLRVTSIAAPILCLCIAAPALASDVKVPGADFRKDVVRLLEVTNALQTTEQAGMIGFDMEIQRRSQENPDQLTPQTLAMMREWFKAEFSKALQAPDGPLDRMAPIYMKYYTHEEVRQLIRFYQSDLGSKVVAVTPFLMQESSVMMQAWFQEALPQMMKSFEDRYRDEGTDPPSGD